MPVAEAFAVALYLIGAMMAIRFGSQRKWVVVTIWVIASLCGLGVGLLIYIAFTIWVDALIAIVLIIVYCSDEYDFNQNTQSNNHEYPGREV